MKPKTAETFLASHHPTIDLMRHKIKVSWVDKGQYKTKNWGYARIGKGECLQKANEFLVALSKSLFPTI